MKTYFSYTSFCNFSRKIQRTSNFERFYNRKHINRHIFCTFAAKQKQQKTMLDSILYFLPCIVSLLWFVSFSFKVKTHRQTFFMWMLACQVFYFATYAVYISPVADYGTMVRMDAVCTPLTLTLAAMILIYQGMHIRRRRFRAGQLLLLLPAVIEGTIVNMLYYMVGFDNAARMAEMYDKDIPYPPEFQTEIYRLYDFFSEPFFSALGTAFTLAIIIRGVIISRNGGYRFGDAYRFFFRERRKIKNCP